jgi:hypothetical protein
MQRQPITSDKTTIVIVIEKQPDGKMRITSGSWNGEKIFLKDQVIEVRHANALGCMARKTKAPDEWDAPIQAPTRRGACRDGTKKRLE